MEKGQDIVLGLTFAILGLGAAWIARSYTGAGGTYPLVLGVVLALFGGMISLRAFLRADNAERSLVDAPMNLTIALVVGVAYISLIVVIGFYTASALVMIAAPIALGFRRPIFTLIAAAAFVAMVYVVFSVVLEKPLPEEIWTSFNEREV